MMQAGGAFSLSSIKIIDPAPLFKAAQTGDVRTLAQLSLKMIEGANSTIGATACKLIPEAEKVSASKNPNKTPFSTLMPIGKY